MRSTGRRFSITGLAFVLLIAAEVLAVIGVWHVIGAFTLLALLAVSVLGLWLVRREGPRAWREFREVAAARRRPGPELAGAAAGLVGAILVAIPGFITALIGLALFLPPVRAVAGRGATALVASRVSGAVAGDLFGPRRVKVRVGTPTRTDTTSEPPIEGEIV